MSDDLKIKDRSLKEALELQAQNYLEQIDARNKEISVLKECIVSSNNLTQSAIDKTIEQDKRIKDLETALKFYANKEMWNCDYPGGIWDKEQETWDFGCKARKALEGKE